ncbi:non-canonical purine NTP diphosphatase [uncultured Eudoraea sp.]|uniref:non-canonical purine NTP diphosphatase n=1 Tax=uncultured Eudoraea sp. TaxID=1035614 RepID=UPI00261F8344|nr:non-canonical purine NTP diphosphatase [uncultured Eudoraea sp.]
MDLIFATHNTNKVKEVDLLLPNDIRLISLEELGFHEEIPETEATLEANAQLKADYISDRFGLPCFSDDTGLIIDALNGAPGVHTARYAGEEKDPEKNMEKVLKELRNISSREARFKTVIALNFNNQKLLFDGIVEGTIATKKIGDEGFGYDPIFRPEGYDQTFAELPLQVKNQISHRGKAFQKLINYLTKRKRF